MAVTRTTTTILGVGLLGVVAAAAIIVTGGDSAPANDDLLVDSETLSDLIGEDDVLVLDARDPEDYERGAIPGAVNVPTDTLNHTVVLDDGTEVPAIVQEADEIAEPLQEAGISEDTHVIVYDNGAETSATRIFWVLDYYGHERVSVLDGGLAGWEASGGDTSTSPPEVVAGDFVPDPQPEKHADFEYVQDALHSDSVMLCNALSAESYEEGSIESSTNLHASSLFEDGEVPYFRGDEVVAQMLEDAGHEPGQEFLSFCGRGYMASINYFAGRLLGLEQVRMYDGSLTDWNARDGELLPAGGQA